MDLAGDVAEMQATAARLRLRAEQISAVAHRLDQHVGAMVYAGLAADRLRSATLERSQRVRRAAARLYEVADQTSRAAGEVEAARAGSLGRERSCE